MLAGRGAVLHLALRAVRLTGASVQRLALVGERRSQTKRAISVALDTPRMCPRARSVAIHGHCPQEAHMTRRLTVLALFAVICLPTPGHAVIIYDERTAGDLGGTPPFVELALGIGVNSVLGSISAFGDFDSFAFTIPAEADLSEIIYSFTLPGPRAITGLRYEFLSGNGAFLAGQNVDLLGPSPISLRLGFRPPGLTSLVMTGMGCVGCSPDSTVDYRVDLVVDEPSAIPVLLLGGLGVLGIAAIPARHGRYPGASSISRMTHRPSHDDHLGAVHAFSRLSPLSTEPASKPIAHAVSTL